MSQADLKDKLVCIVEDDVFLRELIAKKMSFEEFQVIMPNDGESALKEIGKRKPNLIILDLVMPNMDGFEFLEKLRADDSSGDIPAIVFSNLNTDTDVQRARDLGALDFIVKSNCSLSDLVSRIRSALLEQGV